MAASAIREALLRAVTSFPPELGSLRARVSLRPPATVVSTAPVESLDLSELKASLVYVPIAVPSRKAPPVLSGAEKLVMNLPSGANTCTDAFSST